MIRSLIHSLPNVRGRQAILKLLDKRLGPRTIKARHNVMLEGYFSSAQDMSFRRVSPADQPLDDLVLGLPLNAVFIDCGANCGFYSALAARHLGPEGLVISIEPSIREYRRLLQAIQLNPHTCKWIALNEASGDAECPVLIDAYVGHTGMNRIATSDGTPKNGNWVLMRPIDHIINAACASARPIDFMKIDVEGFEVNVLRGLTESLKARRINKLAVEITDTFLADRGESKESLFALLSGYGYFPTVCSQAWQYDEVFVPRDNASV